MFILGVTYWSNNIPCLFWTELSRSSNISTKTFDLSMMCDVKHRLSETKTESEMPAF